MRKKINSHSEKILGVAEGWASFSGNSEMNHVLKVGPDVGLRYCVLLSTGEYFVANKTD